MEVVIQEEQPFTFEGSIRYHKFEFPDKTTSTIYARGIRIPPFKVTQELLDGLISAGLTPRVKVGYIIAGFEVWVGLSEPTSPRSCEGSIEIVSENTFLASLFRGKSHCPEDAKVQLNVTKIVCQAGQTNPCFRRESSLGIDYYQQRQPASVNVIICRGNNPQIYCAGGGIHLELTPTGKSPLFHSVHYEVKRFEVNTTVNNWFEYWTSNSSTWTILVGVKLVLPRIMAADPAVQDHLAAVPKMLTDDILADTKVIAQNGAEIKFHRSFLGAHSPAFERMFDTQMREATSGVLELPDMTEESVRALKEYLYVWELKAPQENSLVCFELFEAGHKYGISTLENVTYKILLRMGGDWYSAVVGLRLFLLVKDMDLPLLKKKAVEILKLKRAELKTLNEYRDLFRKENAAVAMELTECLAAP